MLLEIDQSLIMPSMPPFAERIVILQSNAISQNAFTALLRNPPPTNESADKKRNTKNVEMNVMIFSKVVQSE